ncbi:MAG: SpoIIE family protein phosphatase, partial [Halanaerobiales bacterium]
MKNTKEEIQLLYDQLSANLEKARILHERFLPDELPIIEGMSLDIYYKPALKIGGDFYYFLQYKDKKIFYLSDVSGHGLDGALVNIFVREMMRTYLDLVSEGLVKLEAHSINKFLAQKYRDENFPEDLFFCILIGILDVPSSSIEFSNAGFQFPPVLIDYEGIVREVEVYGPPITALTPDYYYVSRKISLEKDEAVFITTDGLMEETDDNNVMFAEGRIKKVLAESYCLPVKYIIKYLNQQFHNHFGGDVASDDVTFFYLKNTEEKIDKYSFKCYQNQTDLRKVIKELSSLLDDYEIDKDELAMAVNEAVANAFKHGNENREKSFIEISLELKEDLFILNVRDQGSGFNWINEKYKRTDIDIEKIYQNGTGCGMGLYLINKLFDFVFFNETGNCIYMIKTNWNHVS